MTKTAKRKLLEGRLHWWLGKLTVRHRELARDKITGDRAHYWQDKHLKEGNKAAAAANQKQIEKLRPYIRAWERSVHEAADEVHALRIAIEKLKPPPPAVPHGEGWSVPATRWNPYRRKIANWIVRELEWAAEHGWTGIVTSGVRTYAEQEALYHKYKYEGGNIAARPGSSNHEGYDFPRGAIDTPQYEQLNAVLNRNPHRKLLWAITHGLLDWVHFSGTGR